MRSFSDEEHAIIHFGPHDLKVLQRLDSANGLGVLDQDPVEIGDWRDFPLAPCSDQEKPNQCGTSVSGHVWVSFATIQDHVVTFMVDTAMPSLAAASTAVHRSDR